MIPKFRAFLKDTNQVLDVKSIFFELSVVMLSNGKFYQFEDIILMQSTGVYDKHGVEIFEGDIIQQVHAYNYSILEIETDFLEPFEVKKGKYVQGKWIAKEVELKSHSAITCVIGSDVKVIGNISQKFKLLEVTDE